MRISRAPTSRLGGSWRSHRSAWAQARRGDDVAPGAKAELTKVDRGRARIRRLAGRADFQFGSG